jgi:hypothetical protein
MAILALLALLSPVFGMINDFGSGTTELQAMLWSYYSGSGFRLNDTFPLTVYLPFILLRFIPVLQLYRYYNGKTTRKRTVLSVFVGDAYFIFMGLPSFIISLIFSSYLLIFCSPFQSLVALLILWQWPAPESITPWDGVSDSKSWWEKQYNQASEPEKTNEPQKKKPAMDDDVLW